MTTQPPVIHTTDRPTTTPAHPPTHQPTNYPTNRHHQSTSLLISPSSNLPTFRSSPPPLPLISVVVPTYGRPHLLDRCLAALIAQDLDPDSYEIVVARDGGHDDGQSREIRQVVARYAASPRAPRVHCLPLSHRAGPGAARNAGWRAARGEIIAFTDDDCIPEPGWLRAGLAAFDHGSPESKTKTPRWVVGATGRLVMPLPDAASDYARNAAHLADSDFVTANCFYRRDVLEAVGGFDERFGWREDSDLLFRVWKHARALDPPRRLVRAPDAVVVHPVRAAPWGVSLLQQRKSRYNALLYKEHPDLYRGYLGLRTPWHYYGIVAAALAGLWSLTTGRRCSAGLAAAMWGALTGRFIVRRLAGAALTPSHMAEMGLTSLLIPFLSVYWRL
ncbi:MAG TPA: glycosyltransferase family A protein, partial [Anaerolineae bacterium]|nr:glycosyltransferase family A protein [Anaerolineae bacterium]